MNALHNFFFIGMPYMAIISFTVGTIYRIKNSPFKVSSLSSQFLEGKVLFMGSLAFHWGILLILTGHFLTFLFPNLILAWNANPVRLIINEVLAFSLGLTVLFGIITLLIRRLSHSRITAVTSRMDIVLELLLLAQVVLGCWIALGYRWGSSWFAADLTPYLWSILKLNPQIKAVSAIPLVIQLHIIGAFLIFAIAPFTRLVHVLVAPFHYIGRAYQVVLWNWGRKEVRSPQTVWTVHRPKNN